MTTHVLVIDDEALLRNRLRHALESHGYRVTEAENGQAALDLIATLDELPAIVIVDWWMPVMGGEAFLRIVDEDPRLSSMNIAVLSSDPQASLGDARPFIPKPFTTALLLRTLERMAR